jgi:protein gp37
MKQYGRDFGTVTRVKAFNKPLTWKTPRVIFVNSWSDFFHQGGDNWRDEAWDIIKRTPQHTYQILTKRADRIWECLPDDWGHGYSNVWLGVSTESQEAADRRIPHLLDVPVKVRFISAEPLLGPIKLSARALVLLDWVIVGGESGPTARLMDMQWARDIRNECVAVGIPFFFKQQTAFRSGQKSYIVEPDGTQTEWHQMPAVGK